MGIGWMSGTVTFLRRHAQAVSRLGGAFLIVFGTADAHRRVEPLDGRAALLDRRQCGRAGMTVLPATRRRSGPPSLALAAIPHAGGRLMTVLPATRRRSGPRSLALAAILTPAAGS